MEFVIFVIAVMALAVHCFYGYRENKRRKKFWEEKREEERVKKMMKDFYELRNVSHHSQFRTPQWYRKRRDDEDNED